MEHSQLHQVSLSTNTGKACSALRKIIEYQEAKDAEGWNEGRKTERIQFIKCSFESSLFTVPTLLGVYRSHWNQSRRVSSGSGQKQLPKPSTVITQEARERELEAEKVRLAADKVGTPEMAGCLVIRRCTAMISY